MTDTTPPATTPEPDRKPETEAEAEATATAATDGGVTPPDDAGLPAGADEMAGYTPLADSEGEGAAAAPALNVRSGRRNSKREENRDRDERDETPADKAAPSSPKPQPEIDPATCTQMSASDALEKLKAGETLKNVMVVNLDGRGVEFANKVHVVDSILVKPDFSSAVFRDEVLFARVTFLGGAKFGDEFDGLRQSRSWKSELGAHFHGPLTFTGCYFKGSLWCAGIVCHQNANFRPCTFSGVAAFPAAEFKQKVWFTNVLFNKSFSAFEAVFRGEIADFGSTWCEKNAMFARAKFEHRASFWNATFNGDVDFDRAHFGGESNFFHTRVKGCLDLLKSIHARPLDIRKAFVDGTLNLHLCEAPRLLIHKGQVDGHLASVAKRLDFAVRNDFGQLVSIFEDNKDYRSMDWAYHEFRKASRRVSKEPAFVRGLEWLVLDVGTGYGTRPYNIGILMALCILFFTTLFAIFPADFVYNIEPTRLNPPGAEVSLDVANALYFSVATFTTMGFGDWSARHDSAMRFVVILEGFIGLFLMALFVAMLTRKIIR